MTKNVGGGDSVNIPNTNWINWKSPPKKTLENKILGYLWVGFVFDCLITTSCCVKTGENDRFQHKKYIKTQNFKSFKIDQKSI